MISIIGQLNGLEISLIAGIPAFIIGFVGYEVHNIKQLAKVVSELSSFKEDLERIEEKIDHHNNFRDRLTKIEAVLEFNARLDK